MDVNATLPSLINAVYGKGSASDEVSSAESHAFSSNKAYERRDSVTLSWKSQKLSAISKEFFNGPIASNNIAALTQSLYENGFLSGTDLQTMGGEYAEQDSITKAKHTLNSFALQASKKGDDNSVSLLSTIASAIDNMDLPSTQELRQIEIIAVDYAQQFLAKLQQVPANDTLIAEFENVVDVVSTLDTLRQSDQLSGEHSPAEAP